MESRETGRQEREAAGRRHGKGCNKLRLIITQVPSSTIPIRLCRDVTAQEKLPEVQLQWPGRHHY